MNNISKYRRTQKSLEATMNKYKDNEVTKESYTIMSQKMFWEDIELDSWEIAVQVLISTFNYQDMNKNYIYSQPLTIEMIVGKFNIFNQKEERIKEKISKAITSLCKKGILSFYIDESSKSKRKIFTFKQNNVVQIVDDKEQTSFKFFQMNTKAINDILLHSDSDNEKVSLLAMYASICSTMNDVEVDLSGNPTYTTLFQLSQRLGLLTVETLAERIGIKSKATANKYFKRLIELDVISAIKVHKTKDEQFKWSYFYSKTNEAQYLKLFVEIMLLHTQFPSKSSEYADFKDMSWLNIDDVWDDDIHAENKLKKKEEISSDSQQEAQNSHLADDTESTDTLSDDEQNSLNECYDMYDDINQNNNYDRDSDKQDELNEIAVDELVVAIANGKLLLSKADKDDKEEVEKQKIAIFSSSEEKIKFDVNNTTNHFFD